MQISQISLLFSLMTGNFDAETGSTATASATTQSSPYKRRFPGVVQIAPNLPVFKQKYLKHLTQMIVIEGYTNAAPPCFRNAFDRTPTITTTPRATLRPA
jgi:hypothetical protein